MEKQRITKMLVLVTMVVVAATLSIAFAVMSRTLSINGIGKMDTATWDIYFENLSKAIIVRDAIEVDKPFISDDGIMINDMNVKLTKPKDEISYTVDIVNSGTIDAEIESIEVPTFTEEQKKLIDFTAIYSDGTSITESDYLKAGDKDVITIIIKYKDDITEFDLPDEALTINLTFKINYVQSDGFVIEPDGSIDNQIVSTLAVGSDTDKSTTFFNGTIAKEKVESVDFMSTMYVPTDAKDTSWDASESGDGSVVAWYRDSDSNGLYELYIGGNEKVIAPAKSAHLFNSFSNLKTVNFNNNFDTSSTTSFDRMFYECVSLKTLDLSTLKTSNVINFQGVFYNCASLEELDLSMLDTSKVTTMNQMFRGCSSLKKLNLTGINTQSLQKLSGTFISCTSLDNLDFSSFNTSNVTTMKWMFYDCPSLTSLNLSSFKTPNVTTMYAMFYNCSSLTTLDLNSFNTENVTTMAYMFDNCVKLTNLDLSNFNTIKVENMRNMFHATKSMKTLDISNFNTSSVTTFKWMFGSAQIDELDVSHFNTSSATDLYGMFGKCTITNLNASGFTNEKVKNMEEMFRGSKIQNLNLTNFSTASGPNMWYMFAEAEIPNLDLSSFDITKVVNMDMFFGDTKIKTVKFPYFNPASLLYNWHIFNNTTIEAFDFSATSKEIYELAKFKTLLSVINSGTIIYVLDEECKTLGESINPNLTYVVGSL